MPIPPFRLTLRPMSAREPSWQRVCDGAAIAENAAEEFVIRDAVIAVFRHGGKLFALDGMCAHQGGPIAKGAIGNGCVTCPWHGWQYELASGKQTIHNQKLLTTYPVREQDGAIWVDLDRPDEAE